MSGTVSAPYSAHRRSSRPYDLAPLTFTQRAAFRAEHSRMAGFYPTQDQMFDALRAVITANSPANADELLAQIDRAEAAPEDAQAQANLSAIEAACAGTAYGNMLAARRLNLELLPFVAARHALRGWEGPGLPPFTKDGAGILPTELLDLLPADEVSMLGWRASDLMSPGKSTAGNLPPPSSSPGSQRRVRAAIRQKTAASGSSRAKSGT